jgi:hypothetical protein
MKQYSQPPGGHLIPPRAFRQPSAHSSSWCATCNDSAPKPFLPTMCASRAPTVQHAVFAIGIGEERHVTNARVEGLARELDATGVPSRE